MRSGDAPPSYPALVAKARLTITGDQAETRTIEFDGEVVIGRSPRADVQILGDIVSRKHARFGFREGKWRFEDLGSRNGSLVNGESATEALLRTGDVVMIGYGRIAFEALGDPGNTSISVDLVDVEASLDRAVVADEDDGSANATVALSYQNLVAINERLSTIARISGNLATVLDRAALLGQVLDTLFDLFDQLDRSAVVVRDEAGAFRVDATRQRSSADETVMRISTSLIQFVQREGKAVLSEDTAQDDRFSGRESMVSAGGRSIMCAPLLAKEEFLGVIYLDTDSLRKPFSFQDLNLLQGIAGPMAIFLKNAELVSQIEDETRMRTSLSRYLSPDVVSQIGDGTLDANLGGELVTGTVMFSDIVGFTAMAERLPPVEVVDRLNRYFTSMLHAIFGWEGTVDKFGGDAILAVWGAPLANADHARMAASAALDMQARLFDLNLALQEAGEPSIRMALGLNSGKFVAGNIGGEDRIEWTIIGDAVNTAQRVEALGFPGGVLVEGSTWDGLGDDAGAYSFPPVRVKNRDAPVHIFSVRTLRGPHGVTAAIPVIVTWGNTAGDGMLNGAVLDDRDIAGLRIHMAAEPALGPITVSAILPEVPEGLSMDGTVTHVDPLPGCTSGRIVTIQVEEMDEELGWLLSAEGARNSSRTLGEIGR